MSLRMRSELELDRAEQEGEIVADCPGCRAFYEAEDPREVCTPRHRASRRCQSGRRAHCSCETCF